MKLITKEYGLVIVTIIVAACLIATAMIMVNKNKKAIENDVIKDYQLVVPKDDTVAQTYQNNNAGGTGLVDSEIKAENIDATTVIDDSKTKSEQDKAIKSW